MEEKRQVLGRVVTIGTLYLTVNIYYCCDYLPLSHCVNLEIVPKIQTIPLPTLFLNSVQGEAVTNLEETQSYRLSSILVTVL